MALIKIIQTLKGKIACTGFFEACWNLRQYYESSVGHFLRLFLVEVNEKSMLLKKNCQCPRFMWTMTELSQVFDFAKISIYLHS